MPISNKLIHTDLKASTLFLATSIDGKASLRSYYEGDSGYLKFIPQEEGMHSYTYNSNSNQISSITDGDPVVIDNSGLRTSVYRSR